MLKTGGSGTELSVMREAEIKTKRRGEENESAQSRREYVEG